MKNYRPRKESKHLTSYNSTIFSIIYEVNAWGGEKGEFYSGSGSHNEQTAGYAKAVYDFILENDIHEIIEIGCGDFNVTNKILTLLDETHYDFQYTGYDVVKPLIKRNISSYASSKINFVCKDSCTGILKAGDLLIIRQVLQHLSNRSIKQIVNKFKNYKYIVVSEQQIADKYEEMISPNTDKETNQKTRIETNSAVYLDQEPFNCKMGALIFSIPIPETSYEFATNINTYLIVNE
jgi:hypothetical protein